MLFLLLCKRQWKFDTKFNFIYSICIAFHKKSAFITPNNKILIQFILSEIFMQFALCELFIVCPADRKKSVQWLKLGYFANKDCNRRL
jgi:hypothetical protein